MIVFQFVVSVVLIVSTIIVTEQLRYIRNKNLGYDREHVIVMPVDNTMLKHYEDFKNAVEAVPGISSVSGAYETPTFIEWSDGITAETGKEKKDLSVTAIPVDLGFIETIDMKLIAGRDFSGSDLQLMDTSENYKNYSIVSSLMKMLSMRGWTPA